MSANEGYKRTEFGGARSRDRNFGSRKSAKSGQILKGIQIEKFFARFLLKEKKIDRYED